jgi:DNA primase
MFAEVKQAVDIKKIVEYYGIKLDRSLKAKCPFHNEKTASFSININKQIFNCFGCGVGGDAITFVAKLFNIKNIDASKMIDDDFHLGLESSNKLSYFEKAKIEQRRQQQEEIIKAEKERKDKIFNNYFEKLKNYIELDKILIKHRPRAGQELSEEFINALQKISYAEYLLDVAELEVADAYR